MYYFSSRCFYTDKLVLCCGFTEKIDLLENRCSCSWNAAVNKSICRNNLIFVPPGFLLIGLRNTLMDSYSFFHYLFFSSLKPSNIHNARNILCPRLKNKKSLNPNFYFITSFPKLLSELINLKYAFNIPLKITLKTIIMGISSQFHDAVHLNILRTLSSEILLLFFVQKNLVKAWSSILNNNGNFNVQFN